MSIEGATNLPIHFERLLIGVMSKANKKDFNISSDIAEKIFNDHIENLWNFKSPIFEFENEVKYIEALSKFVKTKIINEIERISKIAGKDCTSLFAISEETFKLFLQEC